MFFFIIFRLEYSPPSKKVAGNKKRCVYVSFFRRIFFFAAAVVPLLRELLLLEVVCLQVLASTYTHKRHSAPMSRGCLCFGQSPAQPEEPSPPPPPPMELSCVDHSHPRHRRTDSGASDLSVYYDADDAPDAEQHYDGPTADASRAAALVDWHDVDTLLPPRSSSLPAPR